MDFGGCDGVVLPLDLLAERNWAEMCKPKVGCHGFGQHHHSVRAEISSCKLLYVWVCKAFWGAKAFGART